MKKQFSEFAIKTLVSIFNIDRIVETKPGEFPLSYSVVPAVVAHNPAGIYRILRRRMHEPLPFPATI